MGIGFWHIFLDISTNIGTSTLAVAVLEANSVRMAVRRQMTILVARGGHEDKNASSLTTQEYQAALTTKLHARTRSPGRSLVARDGRAYSAVTRPPPHQEPRRQRPTTLPSFFFYCDRASARGEYQYANSLREDEARERRNPGYYGKAPEHCMPPSGI